MSVRIKHNKQEVELVVKYFTGGWTQKDTIVNETMLYKGKILFKIVY